jgi:serine/threonine-protein kinase HipA
MSPESGSPNSPVAHAMMPMTSSASKQPVWRWLGARDLKSRSRDCRRGARRVLMVKRFDVSAEDGRYQMVSLRTLCKQRPGIYVHGYSELAQVLRKHSASPADDLAALYRHMVFNAAIGNVDDHLKNFWMLARPEGFRLAPAFDLVPDISGRGEHTLSFQQGFDCPTGTEIIALADEWGVARAARIVEDVVKATSAFATAAGRLKVRHPGSLQKVCADVRRRTGLLSR